MPTAKRPTKTTTPKPGSYFEGGHFVGNFYDQGKPYALILAPKAEGQHEPTPWGAENKLIKAATSYSDGHANTSAMAKAGSALAKWARGLNIGGHKDWYIPSRLESLLIFGELRGIEAFNEDQPNGIAKHWYWTSTQYAGNVDFAWFQVFLSGGQNYNLKNFELRARAVRRIPI